MFSFFNDGFLKTHLVTYIVPIFFIVIARQIIFISEMKKKINSVKMALSPSYFCFKIQRNSLQIGVVYFHVYMAKIHIFRIQVKTNCLDEY